MNDIDRCLVALEHHADLLAARQEVLVRQQFTPDCGDRPRAVGALRALLRELEWTR
jgi:hypothetical protein